MLTSEIKQDLQERFNACIQAVIPYTATNSDGEIEQYFEVQMANREEAFYLNVDRFGAVCGDMKHYD